MLRHASTLILFALTLLAYVFLGPDVGHAQADKPGPIIQQCTKTFDNGAGTGTWEAPTNWNPDGVPGSSDTACIGGSFAVTLSSGPVTVAGLEHTSSGAFTISGATLTVTGTTTNQDTIRLNNGAVFNNNGTFNTVVDASSTIAPTSGGGTFNNNGTYNKPANLAIVTDSINAVFNNSGTVTINAINGGVTLAGGGNCGSVCNGSFVVTAGTLTFAGAGTFDLGPSSSISGHNVTFNGPTVNHAGTYNISGTTAIFGGTVNFTGTVLNAGFLSLLFLGTPGTVNFSTGEAVPVTSVGHSSNTLTGSDTVNVSGLYTWSGGTQSGAGTTNANGGMTLSGTGDKTLSGRKIVNTGTATVNGTGALIIGSGGIFQNDGSYHLQVDAVVASGGGAGTFTNNGTFNKSGGTSSTINVPFDNNGTLNITGANLQLNGGGSCGGACNGMFNVSSTRLLEFIDGTFNLGPSASITGDGAVFFSGGLGSAVNHAGTYNITTGNTGLIGGTVNFNGTATMGTVIQTAGTANFNGTATMTTLSQSAGTLGGSGTVTISGGYEWAGGTQSGTGTTNANGGIAMGSAPTTLSQRTLNTSGTATADGNLTMSNSAVFNNNGTYNIVDNGSITSGIGGGRFNNNGTFNKSRAELSLASSTIAVVFNNNGTVIVDVPNASHSLVLNGGGSCGSVCNGTFTVGDLDTLSFAGATFNLGPSSSITGQGIVTFVGATVNDAGTYNVTSTTISAGTANFSGTATMFAVDQTGGTLGGSGTITIASYDWSGGTQSGSGTTNVASTTLAGSGTRSLLGRTFNAASTTNVIGLGELSLGDGAVFNNSGTFTLQADADITATGSAPRAFNNSGTFTKSLGGPTNINVDFNNSGAVSQASGTLLNFTAPYTQTAGSSLLCAAGVNLLDLMGGSFRGLPPGPCTITGNINNSGGTVVVGDGMNLPVVVTLNSIYTQGAGGAFSVPIGGTTPGGAMNNHGQLNISGAALLSGTLSANLISGFMPAAGQSFTVMTYGMRMGNFTSSNLPDISPLSWHVSQGPTAVVLSPVASGDPVINSGGSVNAASFAPGAAVSAGGIAAIFGSNLATSLAVAGSIPLPTTLGGATMKFNVNQSVPKFFTVDSQVNIQVPWELQGSTSANLTDTVNAVTSPVEPVSLAMFAPGLFAVNQAGTGQGAILIANTATFAAPPGSIPGAQSRAAVRGVDFLEIYCTGLGAVTNQPATGHGAGSNPLSATTAPAQVTIGAAPATVLFSGLAPGFVGLYVVTLQVPAGAPPGAAVAVVLTIGGIQSNTVTIAVE